MTTTHDITHDIEWALTSFAASEREKRLATTLSKCQEALREIRDREPDKSSSDQWASFPAWAKERAARALAAQPPSKARKP
jgi:hypothetical protein